MRLLHWGLMAIDYFLLLSVTLADNDVMIF